MSVLEKVESLTFLNGDNIILNNEMNVSCVNDDEDFPVFKAGPPLPIRSKTKSVRPKNGPLKATSAIRCSSGVLPKSSTFTNANNNSNNGSVSKNAESKVKQYIEKVKASDGRGRERRIKPEQMLSLEDLYDVKVVDDGVKSKRNLTSDNDSQLTVTEIHEKLRETMRIVKEKDELINKLRESCHDLAIKCADAENRVDEIRFSYGRGTNSGCDKAEKLPHRGSICGDVLEMSHQHYVTVTPRRCMSVEDMHATRKIDKDEEEIYAKNKACVMIDKATETIDNTTTEDGQAALDSLCQDEQIHEFTNKVDHWVPEDQILQETCSNWMEKIQNWKTDSNFNLSQDSCGDRDSGFRGSAEIETESVRKQKSDSSQIRSSIPRSTIKKCQNSGERSKKASKISSTQMSSSMTITDIGPSHVTSQEDHEHNVHHSTSQHFWPSFTQSRFDLEQLHSDNYSSSNTKAKSLFYEMAEATRNKYAVFQEQFPVKHGNFPKKSHMSGTKSLDVLYIAPVSHHTTEELQSMIDSSFDPPEFILKSHLNSRHRSIDKKMKMLDPLLDDTTKIALRVKRKSEKLAKMLEDACTFE